MSVDTHGLSTGAVSGPTEDANGVFETGPLIVGCDGSTSATAALLWSTGTGLPLVVVRVLEPRPPGAARDPWDVTNASLVFAAHVKAAAPTLQECAWRAELVEACCPAAGLAASARRHGASGIVVGSHGARQASSVLGTEAHQLLAQSDVPVVV